jgi:hypothetical protein
MSPDVYHYQLHADVARAIKEARQLQQQLKNGQRQPATTEGQSNKPAAASQSPQSRPVSSSADNNASANDVAALMSLLASQGGIAGGTPAAMAGMMLVQRQMMQQMMDLMRQMVAIVRQYNQTFPEAPVVPETVMPNLLQQASVPATGTQNPGLRLLRNLLRVQADETGRPIEANPDSDVYAISQANLNTLKQALEDNWVSVPQANEAFREYFSRGPEESYDELAVLYAQAVDQGVLPVDGLLNAWSLGQMNQSSLTALSQGLAQAGPLMRDGKLNRSLVGWMLSHLDAPNHLEREFAFTLVDDMERAWQDDWDSPEGQRLYAILAGWTDFRLPTPTPAAAGNNSANTPSGTPTPSPTATPTPTPAAGNNSTNTPSGTPTPSPTATPTPTPAAAGNNSANTPSGTPLDEMANAKQTIA